MYTIKAERVGKYASRLEYEWSRWFRRIEWPAIYVGDHCRWHDFKLVTWPVEIKPHEQEFIDAACARAAEKDSILLIAAGDPYYCGRWYFFDLQRCFSISTKPGSGQRGLEGWLLAIKDHQDACYKIAANEGKYKFIKDNGIGIKLTRICEYWTP